MLAGSGQGAGGNGAFADGAGTAAAFNIPSGVALDASGNVLVADAYNHRVRRVTPSGGTRPPNGHGENCVGGGWGEDWLFLFFLVLPFLFSFPVPEFLDDD